MNEHPWGEEIMSMELVICRDMDHFKNCYLEMFGELPKQYSDGKYYRYVASHGKYVGYSIINPYSKNWNLKHFQYHNSLVVCDGWNRGLRDGEQIKEYSVDLISKKVMWHDPTDPKSMRDKSLKIFSEIGD